MRAHRFTANSRAGNAKDAARDRIGFERHARACVGSIHRGVTLDGWLVLQRGVCDGAFAGVAAADAPDEHSLCTHLGEEQAARRLCAWRESWMQRQDLEEIAKLGFNAVRLPFGYWCLDGIDALGVPCAPFVGPCEHLLHRVVEWCRELGLKLTLELRSVRFRVQGVGFNGLGLRVEH